ncbi:MAG: cupin domain-containing protein [Actinomycetota bacterium]|nr:cupin domain-containing protein [Actinomycetota bacterium]
MSGEVWLPTEENLVEAQPAPAFVARPGPGPERRGTQQDLVGSRLREARLRSGMGVRELSRKLGISASSISQIELGRVAPSVSTLYALTNALSVSMDSLFVEESEDGPDDDGSLAGEGALAGEGEGGGKGASPGHAAGARAARPGTRQVGPGSPEPNAHEDPTTHERAIVQRRDHRRSIDLEKGVRWELLTPFPEPGAEFLEVRYPVGGGSGATGEAIRHNGRDYCLILEGSLSVQVGFEEYVLGPGDSMAFDATIPHRFWNAGDTAVRSVWFVLDRWLPHGNGS